MRLLVPVNSGEDLKILKKLKEAGDLRETTELYMGFDLPEWYERFGPDEDLNRMSAFRKEANLSGIEQVSELIRAASGIDVYITLNGADYTPEEEEFLDEVMAQLADAGAFGVILGDLFLAETAIRHGLKPVASTMTGIYNKDMARLCVDMGFQRLILPRDLTLEEIKEIMEAVPEAEYECFLMRNGCRYSDSNCLARHSSQYGAICTYLDRSQYSLCGKAAESFTEHDASLYNHHLFASAYQKAACGMCALWDLQSLGVTAGKVVGRADGGRSLLSDLSDLFYDLKIAGRCGSRQEYLEKMRMPRHYDSICYQGLNCYYPEVRYR